MKRYSPFYGLTPKKISSHKLRFRNPFFSGYAYLPDLSPIYAPVDFSSVTNVESRDKAMIARHLAELQNAGIEYKAKDDRQWIGKQKKKSSESEDGEDDDMSSLLSGVTPDQSSSTATTLDGKSAKSAFSEILTKQTRAEIDALIRKEILSKFADEQMKKYAKDQLFQIWSANVEHHGVTIPEEYAEEYNRWKQNMETKLMNKF